MNSFFSLLPDHKFIAVTGEKAASFLQGQVTCDVREINSAQTRLAAHCNPKGRVLSSFRVLQFQEQFYLLTPALMLDQVLEQLKKYAPFSKVTLAEAPTLQLMGCAGVEIAATLQAMWGELPQLADQLVAPAATNIGIVRLLDSEMPRFKILGTSAAIHALQQELLEKYPLKNGEVWKLANINSKIPTIYPQTSGLFTPQMLNYPALNAVSFKKGCYTGQEVIARTQYLGKAKRHLQLLNLSSQTLPKPGDTLCNSAQENIGVVVDAALQPSNTSQVLAVVQNSEPTSVLYWQGAALTIQH